MEILQQKISHVPWFNTNEWFQVKNFLYGNNVDVTSQKKALSILNIWKLRTPSLQAGVEGTLIVLLGMFTSGLSSYETRLIKSASVMRFLNVCAAHDKFQGTFTSMAKKRRIPEWIVSLRHEIAHSQHLPMEDILDKALQFSYNWLYANYWSPVSLHIKEYIPKYKTIKHDEFKKVLEPYIINYVYITLSTHTKWNYKNIGDISDGEVKQSILNDLEALTKQSIDSKTELSQVLQMLWEKIESLLEVNNHEKSVLSELLVENEIFFCDIDEYTEIFSDADPQEIPVNFLFLWESLLKLIHSNGIMSELVDELLKLVNNNAVKPLRRKVAAVWLSELGKAFKKCNLAQNLYQNLPRKAKIKMTTKKIVLKIHNYIGVTYAEYKNVLTLNLLTQIPDVFNKPEQFKEKFLKEPNEYSLIYLPVFLDLCDEYKSIDMKNNIMELIESYVMTDDNKNTSKLHQIDDLKEALGDKYKSLFDSYIDSANVENMDTQDDYNNWRLVTDIDFEKCPIGILPWQSATTNPLLNM